jgi:hypothetical protein
MYHSSFFLLLFPFFLQVVVEGLTPGSVIVDFNIPMSGVEHPDMLASMIGESY